MNVLSFVAVASLLVMSPGPNGLLIAKTVPTSGKLAGFANVAGFVAAFHFHGALSILGISAIFLASSSAFFVVKILGAAYLCWIGVKALRSALFTNGTGRIQQADVNATQTAGWPVHLVRAMNVFLKAERHLQKKMGQDPTVEEIAAECKIPVADVRRIWVLRNRILSVDGSLDTNADLQVPETIPSQSHLNSSSTLSAFLEGFLTNVLNPKTSMFYLAAFPQFINIGDSAVSSAYTLVFLHTLINVAWFGAIVILFARLTRFTKSGAFQRWLDGITGIVFIGFGVKLATYRLQ